MARIAVNTRFLLSNKLEGFGWFTHEVVSRMVKNHPEHEFIFFFDRNFDKQFVYANNVKPVVLGPPARHPILFKIWFDISVKKALKKHQADVFFSPDGYLSLTTDLPQVAVIHDLNFEHYPEDLPASARKYLLKYFPKFAKKATQILTVSKYSAQDIANSYKVDHTKITVAHNGVNSAYRPLSEEEKQPERETLTDGNHYLLYVGSLHPRKNIIRMLQAYDKYREQGGAWAMVIAGSAYWWNKEMDTAFRALKFGQEVIFTGHLPIERLTKVMGAASALLYVSYFEGFGIPVAEAMRCGVPVIAANATSLPEVAGNAAVYCDPFNVEDIATRIQEVAKDEQLRARLSEKGIERASMYNWDNTARQSWSAIEKCLHGA